MSGWPTGDISLSTVLTDSDHLYPSHINSIRQSFPVTVTVGFTSDCMYYCDGVADDLTIRAAIDAVGAAGGGIVFLKNGTYQLSDYIRYHQDNVSLIGENRYGTRLKGAGMETRGSNQLLENFTIDVNGLALNCALSCTGHNKIIRNITFDNFRVWGINLYYDGTYGYGGVKNIWIENCTIENTGSYATSGGSVLLQGGYRNVHVENCLFGSNTNNGCAIEVTMGSEVAATDNIGLYFVGNDFKGPFGKWSYVGGSHIVIKDNVFATPLDITCGTHSLVTDFITKDVLVEGNKFKTTETGDDTYLGLYANGNIVTQMQDVRIIGNSFECGYILFDDGYPNQTYKDIIISKNIWTKATGSPIVIYNNGTDMLIHRLTIEGNIFNDWGNTGVYPAILFQADTGLTLTLEGEVEIKNNQFDSTDSGNTNAILVNDGGGTITGEVRVEGNDMTGCTVTENLAGLLVYGYNDGLNPAKIYAQGNVTGATTFNAINGNVFTATLTGSITGVTISNGKKHSEVTLVLTQGGTGSYTFAAAATTKLAGGSVTLTETVGAVDILRFRFDGTNWLEVSRSLNVS